MNENDLLSRLDRSARTVARLSIATKIISTVMLGVALIMLLYAFSRADNHTDDFIGFSILSIGIAALALVFMGNAAFHAAFGDVMQVAAAMHQNLEHLARLQDHQHRMAAAAAAAAAAPSAPSAPSAPAAPAAPAPVAAGDLSPPSVSQFAVPAAPPAPASVVATATIPAEKASDEPAMKPCPACRKPIRAEALRCRHCFEKV